LICPGGRGGASFLGGGVGGFGDDVGIGVGFGVGGVEVGGEVGFGSLVVVVVVAVGECGFLDGAGGVVVMRRWWVGLVSVVEGVERRWVMLGEIGRDQLAGRCMFGGSC
jgi:hypothetical protein